MMTNGSEMHSGIENYLMINNEQFILEVKVSEHWLNSVIIA